jgi:hypothetical protein
LFELIVSVMVAVEPLKFPEKPIVAEERVVDSA